MEPGGMFNFQNLPNYKFPGFDTPDTLEKLRKWSILVGQKVQAFSFDKPFRKYCESEFIVDFMGNPNVTSTLMKATPDHAFTPLGIPVDGVKFSEVKCTMTNLQLFDKLQKNDKVTRKNGSIIKCMPTYIQAGADKGEKGFEIEIADKLRKFVFMHAMDDDEDLEEMVDIMTEEDKKEFLYILFFHLVTGGSLCQYEDNIEPYIQVTKLLYKDLIAVAAAKSNTDTDQKLRTADGDLTVISYVYKVHSASHELGGKKDVLFTRSYINNFFYIIVNPLKQLCYTLYHHS